MGVVTDDGGFFELAFALLEAVFALPVGFFDAFALLARDEGVCLGLLVITEGVWLVEGGALFGASDDLKRAIHRPKMVNM